MFILLVCLQVWLLAATDAPTARPSSSMRPTCAPTTTVPTILNSGWSDSTGISSVDAIASSESGQYVYAVSGVVYLSSDYGSSFQPLNSPYEDWGVLTVSGSGQSATAGIQSGGLYQTTNFGVEWVLNDALPYTDYWLSIASSKSGQYVFVGGLYDGTWRSGNYGASWELMQYTSTSGSNPNAMTCSYSGQYVFVGAESHLYVSSDYGVSFTTSACQRSNWHSMASSSNGQYFAAIGWLYDNVLISKDFGATCNSVSVYVRNWGFSSISMDSTGQYLAGVIYDYSVYQSGDFGATWVTDSDNYFEYPELICSDSTGEHLVVSGHSTSFNNNSLSCFLDSAEPTFVATERPTSPTVVPTTSKPITTRPSYAPNSLYPTRLPTTGTPTFIAYSWLATTGIYSSKALAASVTGGYVFSVTSTNIYSSSDNGVSFSVTSANSLSWNSIACSSDGMVVVASVSGGGLYRSSNYGVDWSPMSLDAPCISLAMSSNSSSIYAGNATKGIWVSNDYGGTWAFVGAYQPIGSIDCSSNGQYVIGTGYFIAVLSSDYGKSFQTLSAPAYSFMNTYSCACSSSGQFMSIACEMTQNSAENSILVSSDFGESWTTTFALSTNYDFSSIAMSSSGEFQVLCATNNVYQSGDYGLNWYLSGAVSCSSVSSDVTGSYLVSGSSTSVMYDSSALSYGFPSGSPAWIPTESPMTCTPTTTQPTLSPTRQPTEMPSRKPSCTTDKPTIQPSVDPSVRPTVVPTEYPTFSPSRPPSIEPSVAPSAAPSILPTAAPSTIAPTVAPTKSDWNPAVGAPRADWQGVAISSSGQYAVAIVYGGLLYITSDYCEHWSVASNATSQQWSAVASSSSGSQMMAAVYSGYIYKSINFGVTWFQTGAASLVWNCIASSETGQYVFAGSQDDGLYASSDYGESWSSVYGAGKNAQWISLACSSDGVYTIAAMNGGYLYVSSNSGGSWTANSLPGSWSSVTCSSSGQYMAATMLYGLIYTSSNYGSTWVASSGTPNVAVLSWYSITSSSSGQYLAAVLNGGNVYQSATYGSTWYLAPTSPSVSWTGIASDGSGMYLLASASNSTLFYDSTAITSIPVDENDSKNSNYIISILVSMLPGFGILVMYVSVLVLRMSKNEEINRLHSTSMELLDCFLKSLNISVAFYSLLFPNIPISSLSYIFLVLSRLFTVLVWLLFMIIFMIPTKIMRKTSSVPLNLLLHRGTLRATHKIIVCNIHWITVTDRPVYVGLITVSLLDVTLLRLLPWQRSSWTKITDGYPNLLCVYLCLYGNLVTTVLQSLASIYHIVSSPHESQTSKNEAYLFMFVSLFNMIKSFVSVVLFTQLAQSDAMKLVIVHENDVAALAKKKKEDDIAAVTASENNLSPQSISDRLESEDVPLESTNSILHPKSEEPSAAFSPDLESGSISRVKYADETMDVLKSQLIKLGKQPLQYIPLTELKAELAGLFHAVNNGLPHDEARLDYLLMCLELNKEYVEEQEAEMREWRSEIASFVTECLETMRGFVPPFIFQATLSSLMNDHGMSKGLATRLLSRKCLWLVRLSVADIQKIHEADLLYRYNTEAQGLDIVELAAVYAALPAKFENDGSGKKNMNRTRIEQQLKAMHGEYVANTLMASKRRNAVYKNQKPLFADNGDLYTMPQVQEEST